ncbi:MAG TPA: Gfo/Idh/MocA family oxidoreductase [Rhodothermales bacterium]
MARKRQSRRQFMRLATSTGIAAGLAPAVITNARTQTLRPTVRPVAPNDHVRIALIGAGIIGFIDTETALQVPGTELVAVADLYDGRLGRVKEIFSGDVATTRDYREILARPDVDAVIVATPDHWHARIAIDALEAGKHVYLEKPMVQEVEEGPSVIEAAKRTGKVLTVGSQMASSVVYDKVRELYQSGVIGELNQIEASNNRHSVIGAWQYSIPPDASPQTIDWDRFLGDAPKVPFDPIRFFRWRNYWDYGTGVAGDLYVHLFTGIHKILDSKGPTSVYSTGGLRYWHDGRDVPDVILGLFDYPKTETHPEFTLALQTNFVDGSGGSSSFRFIGSEGVITLGWNGVTVTRNPMVPPSEDELVHGYNSVDTWSEPVRQAFVERYRRENPTPPPPAMSETREYTAPEGYDSRLDHFTNFFNSIRTGAPNVEDAEFGYRAAAPALLSNLSYRERKVFKWDPVAMRLA